MAVELGKPTHGIENHMKTTLTPPQPPPVITVGVWGWLRTNLFSPWYNAIITLALVLLVCLLAPPFWHWLVREAHWQAVLVNMRLFLIGLYPLEFAWRPLVLLAIIALLLGGSAACHAGLIRQLAQVLGAFLVVLTVFLPGNGRLLTGAVLAALALGVGLRGWVLPGARLWQLGWLLSVPVALLLLHGGRWLGMEHVSTVQWGGVMLTLLLAAIGIVASFPLGLALALGRQSRLPVIRAFSIVYIEVIRGVPLVSILMLFALLLPLFLPSNFGRPDTVLRVLVGLILFNAAYIAENVRGGLQAIPKGQYEAAMAMGLSWLQSMRYIILPQALRAVIPALVGQGISLFKDTSLATIVGVLELLGVAKSVIEQPEWKTIPGGVVFEVFLWTALVYLVFNYTMSYASRRLERALGVGRR